MFDTEQTTRRRARINRHVNKASPLQLALLSWDNEGGAVADAESAPARRVTPAELMQLRIRVIALENLVISLLAQSTQQQIDRVREMAAYISPRPGSTPHRSTLHAAAQMVHLVERAGHFQGMWISLIAAALAVQA